MPKEITMLTTEQIRTLNDARTILKQAKAPHTWEGGRAELSCSDAEWAIFNALNGINAGGIQTIAKSLMHNEEGDVTRSLGRADYVTVDSNEDGFELHISTDTGSYIVNVHGISQLLLEEVQKEIGEYWTNARVFAAEHRIFACDPDESVGYDTNDPKHPNWFSTHVAIWDERERG
jgi:hypothetical protein